MSGMLSILMSCSIFLPKKASSAPSYNCRQLRSRVHCMHAGLICTIFEASCEPECAWLVPQYLLKRPQTRARTLSHTHNVTQCRTTSHNNIQCHAMSHILIRTPVLTLCRAMQLVAAGGGIEASRALARQQGDLALGCLNVLVDSEPKRCLQLMVEHVLQRLY